MMYIKQINIRDISEERYADEAEKQRSIVERYDGDDLKRTLAGRMLLADMIRSVYGRENYKVFYNKNGKPESDICYFSIAHSGKRAACMISDSLVGVDIELLRDIKKRDRYMLFSADESRYVNTAKDRRVAFFTLWTRKESYIKTMGSTLCNAGDVTFVSHDLSLSDSFGKFRFETHRYGNYILSYCEKGRRR